MTEITTIREKVKDLIERESSSEGIFDLSRKTERLERGRRALTARDMGRA